MSGLLPRFSSNRLTSITIHDTENQAGSTFPSSSGPNESVDIRVGTGDNAKVFHINKNRICALSDYFEKECVSGSREPITLSEDDPVVFDLFFRWADQDTDCYSQHLEEPWLSNAAAAWVLGRKLRVACFEEQALEAFIHNCALLAFGLWEYIERKTPPGSSIRRSSDHWVAWNAHMSGPRPNEFSGLQAVRQTRLVTEKTGGPRIYDVEHWYSSCGDYLNPGCYHDPNARKAQLHQRDQIVVPQREWGRSFEAQRRGLLSGESSSSPPLTLPHQSPAQPNTTSSNNYGGSPKHSCKCDGPGKVFIVLLYWTLVSVSIGLCSLLFKHRDYYHARSSTKQYCLFVSGLGLLSLFIPHIFSFYLFFAVPNGIATALDAMSCRSVSESGQTRSCGLITALSVFTWMSLPMGVAYTILLNSWFWYKCEWRQMVKNRWTEIFIPRFLMKVISRW